MNESTIATMMTSPSPTAPGNISQRPPPPSFKTPMWTATVVLLILMIIVIVFGNLLVLITTWLDKRLHQPNKYFIACLAVADLLVGVFSVPIRLSMQLDPLRLWPIKLCRFWIWMDGFSEMISIVTLTVISVDRYFKISAPFKYRSRMDTSKSVIIIGNIWLISAITATVGMFPYGGSSGIGSMAGRGCFSDNKIHFTVVSAVAFFVPSVIIILMYALIFYIAHQRQKMNKRGELGLSLSNSSKKKGKARFRQELKTIRMLSIVVLAFILCWGPLFAFSLILYYRPELILRSLTKHDLQIVGSLFVVILPSFNSLCNPIIYACFDREYSNAFKHLLQKYILCRPPYRQDRLLGHSSTTRSTFITDLNTRSARNSLSPRPVFELQDNPSEVFCEK